ncbi:mitochondrial chaperone Frataxin [Xylariomycetidae sp. FL0641]|nr:mitochondrial chaperone Frataxin [Xylariomycetidae sp. FL0641]
MVRAAISSIGRLAGRRIAGRVSVASSASRFSFPTLPRKTTTPLTLRSAFSTNVRLSKSLSAEELKTARPAPLTDSQYHELADDYLEALLTQYEIMQDVKNDIDVEYSSGVMNVRVNGVGDYVLNKQPPNKQIWLSSPVSGPKRYDYVIVSEGQDQKQDTAVGDWIYLRDGSSLSELLRKETRVDLDAPADTAE